MKIPKSLLFTLLWLSGFSAAAALPPYVRNSYDTNSAAVADEHVKTLATNVVSQNAASKTSGAIVTNGWNGGTLALSNSVYLSDGNVLTVTNKNNSTTTAAIKLYGSIGNPPARLLSFRNSFDGTENGKIYADGSAFLAGVVATDLTDNGLTASRMVFCNDGNKLVSASASGAVPINADGTATTSAQVPLPTSGAAPYWFKPWNRRQSVIAFTSFSLTQFGDQLNVSASGGANSANKSPTATQGEFKRIYTGAGAGQSLTLVGGTGGSIGAIYRTGRNITFDTTLTVTNTSNQRIIFGVSDSSSILGSGDNPSGNYACFLATTNTAAGYSSTKWVTMTEDNVTQATTVTTSNVDTTRHRFTITFNDAIPNVVFAIDGTTVATHTTHLPSASTNLGYLMSIDCTTATQQGMDIEYIVVESDM